MQWPPLSADIAGFKAGDMWWGKGGYKEIEDPYWGIQQVLNTPWEPHSSFWAVEPTRVAPVAHHLLSRLPAWISELDLQVLLAQGAFMWQMQKQYANKRNTNLDKLHFAYTNLLTLHVRMHLCTRVYVDIHIVFL